MASSQLAAGVQDSGGHQGPAHVPVGAEKRKIENDISDLRCQTGELWLPRVAPQGGSAIKHLPANAGDPGSIPGSARSSGEGNDSPLRYSCLENPVGRGAWRAAVHGVAESRT